MTPEEVWATLIEIVPIGREHGIAIIRAALAEERERCAKIIESAEHACESYVEGCCLSPVQEKTAAAIRAMT